MSSNLFGKYVDEVRKAPVASIRTTADIPRGLDIARDGNLSVHYIPFDMVNADAKVVLVGITPGLTQLVNALREAQVQLNAGADHQTVLKHAKQTGAFSGAMRPNLVSMLDSIGLARWLGIGTCNDLFGKDSHLVHTTSALRYPVFIDGKNYNGTPNMLKHPFLRTQLLEHFGAEANLLRNAVFIPLGDKVSEALDFIAGHGHIARERILDGLPHPSGANAERVAYFLGKKPRGELSKKTDPDKLDAVRNKLLQQVAALG